MAQEQLGIAGLTLGMKQFYNKMLLSRRMPNLPHMLYGRKDAIPRNNGRSMEWRRYTRPAAATTALTEGSAGAETNLTVENVTITVDQYGAYTLHSEVLELQNYDPYIVATAEVYREQMQITLDTIVRNVMTAGTTIQYASISTTRGGASGVGSGMNLTFAEIREAVGTLRRNDAPAFDDGNYIGIIHPDTERDMFADSDIIQSVQQAGERGSANPMFTGRIREFYGVNWVVSSQSRIFNSTGLSQADVYGTIIFGKEYYGVVDYEAMGAEMIVKPKGTVGGLDPLNQQGSIGWKAAIAAARLENARCVRIEHATTTGATGG